MRARKISVTAVTALAAGVAAVSGPAAASAAVSGQATLTLSGSGYSLLKRQGVTVAAQSGATRTRTAARLRPTRLVVRSASRAELRLGGTLVLRRGGRKVSLRSLRATLSSRSGRSRVTALVGGSRRTVFVVGGSASLSQTRGTATVRRASVRLAAPAAAMIGRSLRLRRVVRGSIARLTLTTAAGTTSPPGGGGSPGSGGGGSGGGGGGSTPGTSPGTPTCSGGPGSTSQSGSEPAPLAKPDGAVAIASATMTWRVRPSFVRYIASGEGIFSADGVVPGAASGSPPLVYDYSFPYASGWYDAASGKARVLFGGTVCFRFRAHTIDIDARNPEIEVAGADSRAIFRVRSSETTASGRREVLVKLAPTTPSVSGGAITYPAMAGTIPAGASDSVFASYYLPGDEFGSVSLSLTPAG